LDGGLNNMQRNRAYTTKKVAVNTINPGLWTIAILLKRVALKSNFQIVNKTHLQILSVLFDKI
jgi:hypothetical protein